MRPEYEDYLEMFRDKLEPLPNHVLVDMSVLIDVELQKRYDTEDEIDRQRNRPASYKRTDRD